MHSFTLNRDDYPTASPNTIFPNVIWFLTLNLHILDDFNFKINESKVVQYVELDFKGIDELDNYIEWLKTELNAIIKKNEIKER